MKKEQKAIHGKNAGNIALSQQYPFIQEHPGEIACKVKISRPRSSELEAQTKSTTYMISSSIQNSLWLPIEGTSNGTS